MENVVFCYVVKCGDRWGDNLIVCRDFIELNICFKRE